LRLTTLLPDGCPWASKLQQPGKVRSIAQPTAYRIASSLDPDSSKPVRSHGRCSAPCASPRLAYEQKHQTPSNNSCIECPVQTTTEKLPSAVSQRYPIATSQSNVLWPTPLQQLERSAAHSPAAVHPQRARDPQFNVWCSPPLQQVWPAVLQVPSEMQVPV